MRALWLSRFGRGNGHIHRAIIQSNYRELVGEVSPHWPDGDRCMNAAGREYAQKNLVVKRQIKAQCAQSGRPPEYDWLGSRTLEVIHHAASVDRIKRKVASIDLLNGDHRTGDWPA